MSKLYFWSLSCYGFIKYK